MRWNNRIVKFVEKKIETQPVTLDLKCNTDSRIIWIGKDLPHTKIENTQWFAFITMISLRIDRILNLYQVYRYQINVIWIQNYLMKRQVYLNRHILFQREKKTTFYRFLSNEKKIYRMKKICVFALYWVNFIVNQIIK